MSTNDLSTNDFDEIRRIFVDYARYLDSGDFAGYASLFAANGVLKAQLGEAVGPAEIERTLEEALGPYLQSGPPASIHVMNNHRIDIDGDTAATEVIWFYLTVDEDTVPTILQAGRYDDDLVRENGVWKIARHDISRIFGRSPMTPAPDTRLDQLMRRVQRLEDQDAIWRLFMTYKRHLDQRDFKAYASLFTDDAEWIGNLGKVIGPEQIERLLTATLEVWDDDRERTHHLVLHPVIDVDGDVATAESTWGYVTRDPDDSPVLLMLGRYLDELRRTPDGWRFSRRVAYSDVPYIDISDVKQATAPHIALPLSDS
jgi:ketosteroid isomerase-like protein